MKVFPLSVLISCLLFSCQQTTQPIDNKNAKTTLSLVGVKNEHPNKKMMEGFLNNFEEEFIEQKAELVDLENQNLIQNTYYFKTKSSGVSVLLFFCANGNDALTLGKTNFSSNENNQQFGTNGAVLFVVKGNDQNKVNSLLSHFSGED